MAFEQKPNSGALFRNDRLEEGSNQPNATGRALIGGQEWFISAWTKTDKNGNKFQSLAFKPVEAKRDDSSFEDDFR